MTCKECQSIIVPILQTIAQGCLKLHHCPFDWKTALIIPIPKPGKNPHSMSGYRPISLLSVLGKVVESILKMRFTHWLETHQCLYSEQYGFRRQKSTELALWRFVTVTYLALKQRRQLWTISLDFKSAYDRVWHIGLLVFTTRMNIPLYLTQWVADFLTLRSAIVRVGEADSAFQLHEGVPQGSPLSPILFTIFLDPTLREVAAITNIQAFADDLILWTSSDRHHSEPQHLMLALRRLEQWAHNWRMAFASDKCMAMCIN